MRKTLKEIAGLIQGEVIGDGSVIITGANGIKEAPKTFEEMRTTVTKAYRGR